MRAEDAAGYFRVGGRGEPCSSQSISLLHLISGANRQAVNRLAEMVENPQPIRNQAQKRGQAESPNPLKRLVGHEGFEPSTS
jgi:hypothetical protein